MPPVQRITKEMILTKAYDIVRKNGIEFVTARHVAKEVGCSIQPVFSHFATMDELRQETFAYACNQFMEEILAYQNSPDFLPKVSLWVIRLARNEPHLFHLLYLSNNYKNTNLFEVLMSFETNHIMLDSVMENYSLDREESIDVLIKGFLFLHGIATMISTNHMDFTDEQVLVMMKETITDIVNGVKARRREVEA